MVLINFVRSLPLAGSQADIERGQIRSYIRPRKDILHSCKYCSPPLLWRVASPVAADMPSPALASHPSSEGLSEQHLPPAKPLIPVASVDAAQRTLWICATCFRGICGVVSLPLSSSIMGELGGCGHKTIAAASDFR